MALSLRILSKRFPDWRDAFLGACIVWGIAITALTEGLSLFDALAFWPLVTCWLLISAAAAVLFWVSKPRALPRIPRETSSRLLLSGIGVILFITICVALISAPNNWDSMTYHLTKVLELDGSSFPLQELPHSRSPAVVTWSPWAEFAMLHLQVLSRRGPLRGLCPILFNVGKRHRSIQGIAGQTRRPLDQGQLFAVRFAACTIPMGILQGSSTQNDYVTAFWLVCLRKRLRGPDEMTVFTLGDATLGRSRFGFGRAHRIQWTVIRGAIRYLDWRFDVPPARRCRAIAVSVGWRFCITALNASQLHRNWGTLGGHCWNRRTIAVTRNHGFDSPDGHCFECRSQCGRPRSRAATWSRGYSREG